MPKKKKKGKKKIPSKNKTVDGIKFDSVSEADRYKFLKQQQDDALIWGLELQPEFQLIDPFTVRKRKVRGMAYCADFHYFEADGTEIIEEFKGFSTEAYRMRRKLFLHFYGRMYVFREVKRQGKDGWKSREW